MVLLWKLHKQLKQMSCRGNLQITDIAELPNELPGNYNILFQTVKDGSASRLGLVPCASQPQHAGNVYTILLTRDR